jgi:mercuric reductase
MANHDLIILGSGSTAFAAALRAVNYGAKVLMIEKGVMGGTCINWGCIPSKTLIHLAQFRHEAGLASVLRLGSCLSSTAIDTEFLFNYRERIVNGLRQDRYVEVLKGVAGLDLATGAARFVDAHTVECDQQFYQAERILIAVGGNPRIPAITGLSGCDYLTSRSALMLKKFPLSLVILGGGVIAVELGQMFHRLGSRVTILEHGPRLLPSLEQELSDALEKTLVSEGIKIIKNVLIKSVEKTGAQIVVTTEVDGAQQCLNGDKLLVAVGTEPATAGIGLEQAGVDSDQKGFVITDLQMRTSVPGIWAAGDVVGRMMIASVGAKEGIVAVDNMFGKDCSCAMNYLGAPMAIFTDPEVGIVGHSEDSARHAGIDFIINTIPVSAIPKAHVTGHKSGVIKMIAARESGKLLGVHLVCHRGAELINEAALALRLGATIDDLASTMHVYPSIGEGLKLCAQGFSKDLSLLSCCAE